MKTPPDIPAGWPRPLRLLVACLGQGDQGGMTAPPAQGMTPADWQAFADLAIGQHRVAPVIAPVLDGLDMPAPVRARLDGAIRSNALAVLTHISETRRIMAALTAIGAEPLILKSWPLGAALYGDAGRRHTGDLDLVVPRPLVWDAATALEEIGYRPAAHTAKMRRRARGRGDARLLEAAKDIELTHPGAGVSVELHWQALNYRGWPRLPDRPGAVIRQDSQAGPVQVLSPEANLAYLSTHGALHLWHRLKWLVDIAQAARARGQASLELDLQAARAMGLGRPTALALGLAGRLFGSPVPAAARDPKVAGLERWVLRRLGRPGGAWDKIRYQAGIRRMALGLSETRAQRLGVIGYDTTRRLRLLALDLKPDRG